MAEDKLEIRQRNRATWAAGSWDEVAELIRGVGPKLLDAVEVEPGQEVLDVGTGSGSSVAIPAARRGATVTGADLTPELFEAGRRRAAAAGVTIEWVEADVEELPFDDGTFERVFSTFGHMFAPDHDRAAAELVRVCRPGGVIALATWVPDGYAGQLFGVIAQHLPPPPGARSPAEWGDPGYVRRIFAPHGVELDFSVDSVVFTAASIDDFASFYEENFGPLVSVRAASGEAWPAVRDAVREHDVRWNSATDGSVRIVSDYLVTIGRRS